MLQSIITFASDIKNYICFINNPPAMKVVFLNTKKV